jgi:hypothetical protein
MLLTAERAHCVRSAESVSVRGTVGVLRSEVRPAMRSARRGGSAAETDDALAAAEAELDRLRDENARLLSERAGGIRLTEAIARAGAAAGRDVWDGDGSPPGADDAALRARLLETCERLERTMADVRGRLRAVALDPRVADPRDTAPVHGEVGDAVHAASDVISPAEGVR